jgi:hypothetical protein
LFDKRRKIYEEYEEYATYEIYERYEEYAAAQSFLPLSDDT